jgi:hypothetical protein
MVKHMLIELKNDAGNKIVLNSNYIISINEYFRPGSARPGTESNGIVYSRVTMHNGAEHKLVIELSDLRAILSKAGVKWLATE